MPANSALEYDKGIDITLTFSLANPSANATTAMAMPQGNTVGFVVPTGYRLHCIAISGASNADLTAGTATFVVRTMTAAGGSAAIVPGLSAALSDTVQGASGTANVGACTIAAGSAVGVAVTTTADYAPTTADLDCVLIAKILPA